IGGLGKGFQGNGNSLNAVFKRLGPTQQDLNRLTSAIDERRTNLMRLIHNYGDLTNTLADKDGEITRLVQSSNAVFRSFAAARPYVTNLKPAAQDLSTAMPDLTTSFHELNRFFDIGAYNPGGREPVTGDPVKDRARDEGYLFWLGWTAHLTTSMFQTSDANGPFRRVLAGFDCESMRALIAQTPLAEPV